MEIDETLSSYTFALIAMVLWGIAPIFGKLGLGNLDPLPALMLRSAMVTILLVVVVSVTGKWGDVIAVGGRDVLFIALEGLCAAVLGQLAYFYAIKSGEVSQITFLVAAAPLFTLALAVLVLSENITGLRLAGAAAILLGVILLRF